MLNRIKVMSGVAAVALVVSACQPGVEYDQAERSAAIGAAVGCVGLVALDPTSATNAVDCVRGALYGGAAGAVVGAMADEAEAEAE